jgi:hypothetical protein
MVNQIWLKVSVLLPKSMGTKNLRRRIEGKKVPYCWKQREKKKRNSCHRVGRSAALAIGEVVGALKSSAFFSTLS